MAKKPLLFLVHGPNFSVLHLREKQFYRGVSLRDLHGIVRQEGLACGWRTICFQSSSEGKLIQFINKILTASVKHPIAGVIINAAAYSHTSLALADALAALSHNAIPCCEVHLSNTHAREPIRHTSFISPVVNASVCGMGVFGYRAAVQYLNTLYTNKKS